MSIRRSGAALSVVLAFAGLASPAVAQSQSLSSQLSTRIAAASVRAHPATPGWSYHSTGSSDPFYGVAAVSTDNAWISSDTGLVLTTRDRGATWQNVSPPQASGLMLRTIEATQADMKTAVALSVGLGRQSGVFVTSDGGRKWTRTFTNENPDAQFECMAVGYQGGGLAIGDPIKGAFQLISTTDGGNTWAPLVPTTLPRAMKGEVLESGGCLTQTSTNGYLFGTAGPHPRVFRTTDSGETWTVASTPVQGGHSVGIYAVGVDESGHAIAVGGDPKKPAQGTAAAAMSSDGGATWTLGETSVTGFRSGVAWASYRTLAVGPKGSDISLNNGNTWTQYSETPFNDVSCASRGACWAVGSEGVAGEWTYVH